MKSHVVTREDLRRRVKRAVLAGLVFVTFTLATVIAIRLGPKSQRLPVVLRKVQKLNEKVGESLAARGLGAPCKTPPEKGTPPRVNGLIGLEDDVDPEMYRVIVESGSKKLELKIDDILGLPRTEAVNDFKCIEGWTEVFQYAGVRFSDFMRLEGVGLHDDGTPYPYVGMETPDGKYYVSIDARSMMSPDTALVWEMNGAELSVENGYPLRLIIPNKYGIKNLKRIGRIFFSDTRPPDYWNKRGYDWFSGL